MYFIFFVQIISADSKKLSKKFLQRIMNKLKVDFTILNVARCSQELLCYNYMFKIWNSKEEKTNQIFPLQNFGRRKIMFVCYQLWEHHYFQTKKVLVLDIIFISSCYWHSITTNYKYIYIYSELENFQLISRFQPFFFV